MKVCGRDKLYILGCDDDCENNALIINNGLLCNLYTELTIVRPPREVRNGDSESNIKRRDTDGCDG